MKTLSVLAALLLVLAPPAFAEDPETGDAATRPAAETAPAADEEAPAETAAGEEAEVTKIPETTVTETRNPVEIGSLTGRTTVRELEDSRKRGAWTLEEAINDVPAIDIIGSARYGQEVSIQMRGVPNGFSTQRVLMLLDGRPLTQEYTGNVDVAQFPLAAYRRVEVAQGPASAAYGTNALGGVVNFLPRRGGEVPVSEIYLEGGSHTTLTSGLAHGAKIGEVDYFVNLDMMSTDGYLDNSAGQNMDWQRRAGFLNLGWETERADIRGYLYALHGQGTDESFDREVDRWSLDLSFTYDVSPENDGKFRARVWHQAMDQELAWFYGATTEYDLWTSGLNVSQTWAVTNDHLLTGGGELYRQSVDVVEPQGDVDVTETTWSLFLQDEWSVDKDVRLVAGIRYDKPSDIDGEFSWRLGANWRVSEEVTLRGSGGKAFRTPAISDRYLPTTQYFGVTFEGNPLLEPETLYNAEVGGDWYFARGWSTTATVFASRADGFSDFIMDTDGVFRPDNITSVDFRGVGLTLAGNLGSGFHTDAGYTFTDAVYEEYEGREEVEGNRIDGSVRHLATVAFGWDHAEGHGVTLSALFSGDRYTDPENTGAGKLDPYFLLNLQARYRLTKFALVTLNIVNLLDEEYATRIEYEAPGRSAFLGIRITF